MEEKNKSKKSRIENFKIVLVLVLIAAIAGVVLGVVKPLTDIDQEKVFQTNLKLITDSAFPGEEFKYEKLNNGTPYEKENLNAYNQVVSVVKIFSDKDGTKIKNAYLFEVVGKQAYKGQIVMYVLINDNKVASIAAKESNETPGLGSKVLSLKYYESSYIGADVTSFNDEFVLVKGKKEKANEVVLQSGATKTSTALKNALNGAVRVYRALLAEEK